MTHVRGNPSCRLKLCSEFLRKWLWLIYNIIIAFTYFAKQTGCITRKRLNIRCAEILRALGKVWICIKAQSASRFRHVHSRFLIAGNAVPIIRASRVSERILITDTRVLILSVGLSSLRFDSWPRIFGRIYTNRYAVVWQTSRFILLLLILFGSFHLL